MASLAELASLHGGGNDADILKDRIRAAVLVAAEAIRVEVTSTTNHAARLVWARKAFSDPRARADELWGAILGANSTFSITNIIGANDAAVLAAVNNAVNVFIDLTVP